MKEKNTKAAWTALLVAAKEAETFIAGFEGDEAQEGIEGLLKNLRSSIAEVDKSEPNPYFRLHDAISELPRSRRTSGGCKTKSTGKPPSIRAGLRCARSYVPPEPLLLSRPIGKERNYLIWCQLHRKWEQVNSRMLTKPQVIAAIQEVDFLRSLRLRKLKNSHCQTRMNRKSASRHIPRR
jgi:hypothetical protein